MATRPLADMAARRPSADLASSVYLIASDGRTLSLPIPSDSPNDPLNWSRCTRVLLLVSVAVLAGVGVTQLNAPPVMRHALALEFGEDRLAGFDMATTIPDVMFGVGVIVWTPLCIGLGRRLVLLLSGGILLLALAAAGLAPSLEVLIAAIGFQGLACGGVPTAGILMVIDITYIHQRPLSIAVLCQIPRALHRPPYSMSSPDVGLMDLSAALGCFAAPPIIYAITASTVGTLTRRNAAVRKATYYLPGFILPVLCGVLANVLFGLAAVPPGGDGYVNWVHRWAFVAVAWVLAQVAFTGEAVVSTLWVTEAFPQWAAGALAAVNGLSFAFSCCWVSALPSGWLVRGTSA
ncbi:hypothetical protein RB596_008050 [Gaeumannomyces avenae]